MKGLLLLLLGYMLIADVTLAKKRKSPKLLPAASDFDEDERQTETEENMNLLIDPCLTKHCGAGQVCALDQLDEPYCKCIEECPFEEEARRKVCSNHNVTWASDCELYRMRCWCKKEEKQCNDFDLATKESYKHMHIDYFGECREMEECTAGQMADFPRRMRDWLFNIMRDLAERNELTKYYMELEKEAENNLNKRWLNAALWKWCDLDTSNDRAVSRHELFPIKAPLVSMEHCIAPFLNKCDANNDHFIHLNEWIKCMELDENEIEEKCEDIRDYQL
ncbi:SPARC [Cimex lectularius]|uniref:SPARC/Testican calcium-binding domain-containing protein n=1 Tax=Cimex lectularius TaxID=79782 RepID=A0A8I6RXQ0_CIMLE|nr:SPARC [Cimex lectularius]